MNYNDLIASAFAKARVTPPAVPAQRPAQNTQTTPLQEDLQKIRSLPDGEAKLNALIEKKANNMMIPQSEMARLAQGRQQFNQMKTAFYEYCTQQSITLHTDEARDPILEGYITQEAEKMKEGLTERAKIELIANCGRVSDPSRVAELYDECKIEMDTINRIQNQLNLLIKGTKIPTELEQNYKVKVEHSRNPANPCRITVDNIVMGYSMFTFLKTFDLINDPSYVGQQSFTLTQEKAAEFTKCIADQFNRIEEMSNILAGLFNDKENTDKYVYAGRKPVSEIIKSSHHVSPGYLNTFNNALRTFGPTRPCLMLFQVQIDLNEHPEKAYLKDLIQQIYRTEKMKSADGKDKQFLLDDPYRSLLNEKQLRRVGKHLNRLLHFQQTVKDFTCEPTLQKSMEWFGSMGINFMETNYVKSCEYLKEMTQTIEPSIRVNIDDISNKLQTPLAALGSSFPLTNLNQDEVNAYAKIAAEEFGITGLQNPNENLELDPNGDLKPVRLNECAFNFHRMIWSILKQHAIVCFKPKAEDFSVSVAEKNAIYGTNPATKTYAGNVRKPNIPALFAALKASPAVRKLIQRSPGYAETLASLEADFEHRLNTYSRLSPSGPYGQGMIDTAISLLEEYVQKIVYQSRSKVSDASIESSLNTLAGLVGTDSTEHCNTGFSGRMQLTIQQLQSRTGQAVEDAITNLKQECINKVLQEPVFAQYAENSMMLPYVEELREFIGLKYTPTPRTYDNMSYYAKEMFSLLINRYYTPSLVYETAVEALKDAFWNLCKMQTEEQNDTAVYQFLMDLGYGTSREELDRKYRLNGDGTGKWHYGFFVQDLPQHVIPYLVKKEYILRRSAATITVEPPRQQQTLRPAPVVQPPQPTRDERGTGIVPATASSSAEAKSD